MKRQFYSIIINDYADNSHLTARIFNDGTRSVHVKKGEKTVYTGRDASLIKAFVNRASEKLKGTKKNHSFRIVFDYHKNRLNFAVKKGGVITQSVSRMAGDKIEFDSKDDIFIPENYNGGHDILSKFQAMRECADGFMRIVDHKHRVNA